MKTITIRGIDTELDEVIRKEASRQRLSVNRWVLHVLRSFTGQANGPKFQQHHDLDHLAGTWTKENVAEFKRHTSSFEAIDKEMWG